MPEAKPAEKPRYYHQNGKIYDAGVEISDAEVARMNREYPQKIAKNSKVAGDEPMAANIAAFANKKLQSDLDQVNAAVAERDKAKAGSQQK